MDHERRDEILCRIFFRQNQKDGALLRGKHFGIDGAVIADDLFQLRIQKGVEAGHDGGHDRSHRLIRTGEGGACQPPGLMLRWQFIHEQLKAILAS